MPNMKHCEILSNAFGPSGHEHLVADAVTNLMDGFPIQRDAMQNIYAHLPQNSGNPLVLLDAHLDEVGFMIQSITKKGLLKLVPLGGWIEHNIPAHSFLIRNRKGDLIRAIATSKPPHFMSTAEKNTTLTLDSIMLDAGVCSKEDATELLLLEPGLVAVPETLFSYQKETDILLGKAFDCRLGCASLIEVMQTLKRSALSVDVTATFSTQEELGLRGAKVAVSHLKPRLAICLEGTPADDTFTSADEAQGVLKKGAQLRFRDSTMIAHPQFVTFAREVAQKNNIPLQMAVRTGGGTNAGTIHTAGSGVPTLVLGIPVRYAHTHYGYSAGVDIDAVTDLTCAILESLTPEIIDTLSPVL